MLRSLKTPHLKPMLMAWKSTSTASTATFDYGGGDYSSITREEAGRHRLVPKTPKRLLGPVIGTAGEGAALGEYVRHTDTPTAASLGLTVLDTGATGKDCSLYGMYLAYEDPRVETISPPQTVSNSAGGPRLIALRITNNAIASGSKMATLSVSGNQYTITYAKSFSRAPVVVATVVRSSVRTCYIVSNSVTGCVIAPSTATGTAGDDDIEVLILGWDRKDDQWGRRVAVQVPQMEPRVLGFVVDGTGTASITFGSEDASITDNGTGDYTLTFTKPFKRAPICVVTAPGGRANINETPTTTAVRCKTFTGSTSVADRVFHLICVGYDYADEV